MILNVDVSHLDTKQRPCSSVVEQYPEKVCVVSAILTKATIKKSNYFTNFIQREKTHELYKFQLYVVKFLIFAKKILMIKIYNISEFLLKHSVFHAG